MTPEQMRIEQALLELDHVDASEMPFRLQVKYSNAKKALEEILEELERD